MGTIMVFCWKINANERLIIPRQNIMIALQSKYNQINNIHCGNFKELYLNSVIKLYLRRWTLLIKKF
jgi:hypothetical protein